MSQVNVNSDNNDIRANKITILSDRDPIGLGPIALPSRSGALGQGLVITKSSDTNSDGEMEDSRGVIPSGVIALYCSRLNNQVFWTLQQIDGNNAFTCGATNTPLWLGKWPLTMRPQFADGMFLPITVQKNTGERETMFLVVSPNGNMTLNPGNSTLFTSGNQLYLGGSGVFVIENY